MAEILLEVQDFSFGVQPLFRVPRFKLEKGEKVLLMGPSGCGKTSFIEFIGGHRPAQAKSLRVNSPASFVFQDLNLIDEFSIRENLALELSREQMARALEWLAGLDFDSNRDPRVSTLSEGEQQRVSVVRALAAGRELILADEPTSHLDRGLADRLMALIKKHANSALVVSHDEHLKRFFDRVVLFEDISK